MKDWNGDEVRSVRSRGGVVATAHPYDNLIRTGCPLWPPAEIVQKLYRSRHATAFGESDRTVCESGLGYYCDLQSLNSEDSITWSVFGVAARAPRPEFEGWLRELTGLLDLGSIDVSNAEVSLWRRLPHPDTLVPGGPEVDVAISTPNAVLIGEAKWRSPVGTMQGKARDKDQIRLRGEYLLDHSARVFPGREVLAVFGVGLSKDAFLDTTPSGIGFRTVTWEQVCELPSHPHAQEVTAYYRWKRANAGTIRGSQ